MIKVSTTGMVVSQKTDLRFPVTGQQGHGHRIIQSKDWSRRIGFLLLYKRIESGTRYLAFTKI